MSVLDQSRLILFTGGALPVDGVSAGDLAELESQVAQKADSADVDQVDNTPDIAKPVSVQQADALADPVQGYVHDFYSADEDPTVAVSLGGQAVFAVDAEGRQLQPTLNDFYSSDEDDALTIALDDGKSLLRFDDEGRLRGYLTSGDQSGEDEGDVTPGMIPYVTGSQLRAVGATDVLAAELGDYEATLLAPGNLNSVRAVIDRPSIGLTTTVSVANGFMIPDAIRVLHVSIVLGQSLAVGANSNMSLVLTAQPHPDDALMLKMAGFTDVRLGIETVSGQPAPVLDPATIVGFAPLVARASQTGNRGQTVAESAATSMALAAREIGVRYRSVSMVHGVGGTVYDGLKKGSQVYANMLLALQKLMDLAESHRWRVVVDDALIRHGESDGASTSYFEDLMEWQSDVDADVKLITGQSAPVHFIMAMPSSASVASFAAVRSMLRAHNESEFHHLSGPDYPFGDQYAPDYLHGLGPLYHWSGEVMGRAARQVLWTSAGKSKIVQITDAVRSGLSVVLEYEVPVAPLTLDVDAVSNPGANGFRYFDASGEITVTAVAVTGPNQVTLTLGSAPSGSGEYLTYAMTPQADPRTATAIPRGNLRDSNQDKSTHLARPLHNWAVHQRFDL